MLVTVCFLVPLICSRGVFLSRFFHIRQENEHFDFFPVWKYTEWVLNVSLLMEVYRNPDKIVFLLVAAAHYGNFLHLVIVLPIAFLLIIGGFLIMLYVFNKKR